MTDFVGERCSARAIFAPRGQPMESRLRRIVGLHFDWASLRSCRRFSFDVVAFRRFRLYITDRRRFGPCGPSSKGHVEPISRGASSKGWRIAPFWYGARGVRTHSFCRARRGTILTWTRAGEISLATRLIYYHRR